MSMPELLQALAEARQSGKPTELNELARAAIIAEPAVDLGYYCLAEALFLAEQYQNAEIALAKAIELAPKKASYLLRMASYKDVQGQAAAARILYDKALALEPQNWQALVGLAHYQLFEAQNVAQALEYLNQADPSALEEPSFLRLKAKTLLNMAQLEEALELIERLLEKEANEAALTLKLNALMMQAAPSFKEISLTYKALIQAAAQPLPYWVGLANYLLAEEQYSQAEKAFRKALSMAPAQEQYALKGLLAICLQAQGQYAKALNIYQEMEQEQPEDEEIYIQKSLLFAAQDEFGQAAAALEKVIALSRGMAALEWNFKRGLYLLEAEDYAPAKAIFEALLQEPLYAREAAFALGKCLHLTGDAKAAFAQLQAAQKAKSRKAKDYLQTHFETELKALEAKLLAQRAAWATENAKSAFLAAHFGQLGRFDPKQNRLDPKLPADVQKMLKERLADISLLLSAEGLLLLNPMEERAIRANYRILEEEKGRLLIELFPLDGSPNLIFLLRERGPGRLSVEWQKAGAEEVHFQLSAKPKSSDMKVFKRFCKASDFDYLGAKYAGWKKYL
ncbi:hypothetical protein SapgrDRAFT_2008 [Saprospira grandis DSM 2844]|uniref:Uncharacterized protein n=1 Tax=Saprospira grandis DSM 2844 TaxID=694433 RepID=J0P833_9BACT|nr:tetratricopeptide repeat protein [Saprospira grandis]EJF53697.1 hypothetical protein SapgrDRAFT_2008 [Saprospira grandis DSM 2844]